VRLRAGRRCEYCRKPENVSTYTHQVEHIIPRKQGGSSDLDNLAWACFQCNVAKGTDVAAYDQGSGNLTPLFNPRTQTWDDCFEMDEARIVGRNAVGRVTVFLLQFNHPEQIEMRQRLINAGEW
jgi:hypothetical protein